LRSGNIRCSIVASIPACHAGDQGLNFHDGEAIVDEKKATYVLIPCWIFGYFNIAYSYTQEEQSERI